MSNKLAYLCSSKSWGGLEMNHLRNAEWMSRRGHDVVIIGIDSSPFHTHAQAKNLPFLSIGEHRKYIDFKASKHLKNLIISEGITHLIIRSNYDMSILAAVKRMLKSRLHTSYFMEMQLGVKKTDWLHTMRFNKIDLWSCPLNWLEKQVNDLTRFKNQLVVIPSGMDLSSFDPLIDQKEARNMMALPAASPIFGLIGRFDPQKGQLLLLEAMKQCTATNFSVVLLGEPTIGEHEEYHLSIKQAITDNQLENRVDICSFREDIATFYSAVDWIVMATKAETFGMVTIEALASGTPILGSNAGGTPEILENEAGGRLFQSMDPTDLAEKIDQICSQNMHFDPDVLKNIAKQYDHNTVCLNIEKYLGLE